LTKRIKEDNIIESVYQKEFYIMKTLNWKIKAFIQNFIALLPQKISYELYFQIQRYFGGLKKPLNPMDHFSAAVSMLRKIQQYGGGNWKNIL
jgi:hypothetical protein